MNKSIKKIAFAGCQDTGKTTTAKYISAKLTSKGFITAYVSEAVRDFIVKWGESPTTIADQLFVFQNQLERERLVAPKTEYMFTDSPTFLSYVYGLRLINNSSKKDVDYLTNIYAQVLQNMNYSDVFYLKPFRPVTRDGVRSESMIAANDEIDFQIKGFLDTHLIKYHTVDADNFDDRMKQVLNYLGVKDD